MIFKEKTLDSEYVFRGKLINVRRDRVTTVNGESIREIVEHANGVVIAALKPNGMMLMERQFRNPVQGVVFEAPAGKIDPGEEPEHAAARELREETGYTAGSLRFLTKNYPSVGFSDELLYTFLATDLTSGKRDLDENEAIDIEEYSIDELTRMAENGEISDGKTLIAILMVRRLIDTGELNGYLNG